MITVNGQKMQITESNLSKWLTQQNIDNTRVAVELNGDLISADKYAMITLKSGDIIEIVTFVGGG